MIKACSLIVLTMLVAISCRDYDLHSRVTDQSGLIPPDQFAQYGQEQAEAIAVAREFGAAVRRVGLKDTIAPADAAAKYARTLADIADVRADPTGWRLTLRFKSGWRTMVTPIEDGKRGAETLTSPGKAAPGTTH